MIIVEGPDGGGKTTLINNTLVERTGLPVAPRVVSKDAEAMTDLVKWTEENVRQGWQDVIYDRHRLISEPIYGPILRERFEQRFDNPEWLHEMFFELYHRVQPLIIYCLPPFSVVWKNVRNDDENKVVQDKQNIRAIYGAYLNRAMLEGVLYKDAFIYDYTDTQAAKYLQNYLVSMVDKKLQESHR